MQQHQAKQRRKETHESEIRMPTYHIYTTREGYQFKVNDTEYDRLINGFYQCDLCSDMGVIWALSNRGDGGYEHVDCPRRECAKGNENRREAWERAIKAAEVPAAYLKFTFDTFDALLPQMKSKKEYGFIAAQMFARDLQVSRYALQEACQLAQDGIDTIAKWLVLFGPVGTGKTGLMVAAANAMLDSGYSVNYIKLSALFRKLNEAMDKAKQDVHGADTVQEILDKYHRAKVLCLDELNIELKQNDTWHRQVVENLLRFRYEQRLPMIITMNLTQDEFEHQWGERSATVIRDMGLWVLVEGVTLRSTNKPIGK